jgi:SAM-dependent methyltransferase
VHGLRLPRNFPVTELIERAAPAPSVSIIGVGGGESTLADDLLACGYQNITVLDVSQTAVDLTRNRLGPNSERVRWMVADMARADLAFRAYDVWHDRAVFHFLTAMEDRMAYPRQVAKAVKPGVHVLVSTSGPGGRPNAAASTLFVMMRSHCTKNSACGFAYSTVLRNCIALRLAQRAVSLLPMQARIRQGFHHARHCVFGGLPRHGSNLREPSLREPRASDSVRRSFTYAVAVEQDPLLLSDTSIWGFTQNTFSLGSLTLR